MSGRTVPRPSLVPEATMNNKTPRPSAKRIEGSLTEALGKLTGDKAVEAKGAATKREAEKATGRKKPVK